MNSTQLFGVTSTNPAKTSQRVRQFLQPTYRQLSLKTHVSLEVNQLMMCTAVSAQIAGLMASAGSEFVLMMKVNASPRLAFAAIREKMLADSPISQVNQMLDSSRNSTLNIP